MSRRALIFGVSGQDGAYLARLLLAKGYEVSGTSRAAAAPVNHARLGIADGVTLHRLDPDDRAACARLIADARPDEIYYLAGQSSVARSFETPSETFASAANGLLNVVEAARADAPDARLLNAASGDCFGETSAAEPAAETSRFAPRSPYAAGKCAGHHLLAVNRLAHRQWLCSAFLFPHESPLRPPQFAIAKIVAAVARIARGSRETLDLGDVAVVRDWGWAPEYVEAMWRMLQHETPEDLVIATGRAVSLQAMVAAAFEAADLDWRDHVRLRAALHRPADISSHHADPARAQRSIDWRAELTGEAVVRRSCARLFRHLD